MFCQKSHVIADLWVQIDIGSVQEFDSIVIYACNYLEQAEFGKGFGFPVRFRIEKFDTLDSEHVDILFETKEDLSNPCLNPYEISVSVGTKARFIKLTVTKSFVVGNEVLFALDEIQILAKDKNLALGKPVTCANSLESSIRAGQYDWHIDCLTDGYIHLIEPQHDQGKGNLLRRLLYLSKPALFAQDYTLPQEVTMEERRLSR